MPAPHCIYPHRPWDVLGDPGAAGSHTAVPVSPGRYPTPPGTATAGYGASTQSRPKVYMGEVPGGSGWGWVSPTAPLLGPLKYESPTPHHPYSTHSQCEKQASVICGLRCVQRGRGSAPTQQPAGPPPPTQQAAGLPPPPPGPSHVIQLHTPADAGVGATHHRRRASRWTRGWA